MNITLISISDSNMIIFTISSKFSLNQNQKQNQKQNQITCIDCFWKYSHIKISLIFLKNEKLMNSWKESKNQELSYFLRWFLDIFLMLLKNV
jgi:hypothetical protein